MTSPMRVAAVVVNYNGAPVTRACVDSLRRSEGVELRIIIADNASTAADRRELQEAYGGATDVEIVDLEENRHFAGGVNAGALRALAAEATHLFVLNNDTVVARDCVARLVATAKEFPGAGVVGPVLLDLGDRHPLSLGERYSTWSLAIPRTVLRVRSTGPGGSYRVGGVMGSAVLLSRECLERVGPYDEGLLVYYEEVDFCLRARRLGYQPRIDPAAVVLHDGMRGFASGLTPYAGRLKSRNLIRLMRKHGTLLDWIVFLPTYFALLVASSLLYVVGGRFDVARSMWSGLRDGWSGDQAPDARSS